MGSPTSEKGRGSDETQHEVTLTKPYYLAITEVTNAQYRRFKRDHESPSYDSYEKDGSYHLYSNNGDDQPASSMSWNDAQAFREWLSRRESGRSYRLPTEAEWEYAARAGTTTRFSFGERDSDLVRYGNFSDKNGSDERYMHKDLDDGHRVTAPVGNYRPNPWGLFDMHGNVYEWTQDWYQKAYPSGRSRDPAGPTTGTSRVLRGGSYYHPASSSRSAQRFLSQPTWGNPIHGFRLASPVTP
jgi:formylglycine-generating enzyme required for sulfatase activity